MTKGIDFTNCPRVFDRAYNGANGKKIAVEYGGRPYMLKFPPSGEGKPTELSYTNSCISEHIASSIFNMLGIKAQFIKEMIADKIREEYHQTPQEFCGDIQNGMMMGGM